MANVCSLCKRWQADDPGATSMTCPHDGPGAPTETRCAVCSTMARSTATDSNDDVATIESVHNSVPDYHVFE